MKVGYLFTLLVATSAQYGGQAASADDDDAGSQAQGGGYGGAQAAQAPAYHAPAAAAEYHPPAAAAAAYHPPAMAQTYAAPAEELHIHPSCNSGGPTPMRMGGGYRMLSGKVQGDRSLEEDDLEEPFDDPGCGHGVCVLAPGGHGECICDAAFMTTPTSGPCGQHQKSQGVAFILQLFLGFFGAGAFYLGSGWVATGVVCLLFGALGVCIAPIIACASFGLLKCIPFCRPGGACGFVSNQKELTLCCVGFLHCVALITWFVSLIIIGVNCKVNGIPCVPM
jgi:hypothetical protein